MKSQFSEALLLKSKSEAIEAWPERDWHVLPNVKSIAYIEEIFAIWVEQRVVREVCKQKLLKEEMRDYDIASVQLDIERQFTNEHELLKKDAAIDVMKLMSGEPVFDKSNERQKILKNYVQMLVAIADDPYL